MGFFDKLKSGLGIGGVKVNLQVPGQISRSAKTVNGKVVLTSKNDQEVKNITVKLIEEWTTDRGEKKKTKEYELGEITFSDQFAIKANETKEVPFSLDYEFIKSQNDVLKEGSTKFEKVVDSFSKFMDNEKSKFFIHAEADIVSTAGLFDPTDKKGVKLVD